MIKSPITKTLSDSYQAIELGDEDAFGFSVYAVDSTGTIVPFYYATDEIGTGESLSGDMGLGWPHYEKAGATVMYAKAFSGTPVLVLNPGKWVKY